MMGRLFALMSLVTSLTLASSVAPAQGTSLPNLVPRNASFFSIGATDYPTDGERALRFDTQVMNLGAYALDLLTGPPRSSEDLNSKALQCIEWDGRLCQDRKDIGDVYFDAEPGHLHFHFADFARYELWRVVGGAIDTSPQGLVAENEKESFCMEDSQLIEPSSSLIEQLRDKPPFYLTCDGILQGISPGYQDNYPSGLPGQQVVIDGVPDGTYALVTIIDPNERMSETNDNDNTSTSYLRISEQGTKVDPL